MKNIEVSTDVFARIWGLRAPNESNEDEILSRVLAIAPVAVTHLLPRNAVQSASAGFFDTRHGVRFEEGFEIFRTYRGKEYRAVASGGTWVMSHDKRAYQSLNELSRSIGAISENSWKNWYFLDKAGSRRYVNDLRNATTISNRSAQRNASDALIGETTDDGVPNDLVLLENGNGTWRDDVRFALESLGGKGRLHNIYRQTEKLRRQNGRSIPTTLEAVIRRTLEDHSSDSHNYRGGLDLFFMPEGKGMGIWALRT